MNAWDFLGGDELPVSSSTITVIPDGRAGLAVTSSAQPSEIEAEQQTAEQTSGGNWFTRLLGRVFRR